MKNEILFAHVLAAEREYERLKREKLGERFTPLQLAEMLDTTGYVQLYNVLIDARLEGAYTNWCKWKNPKGAEPEVPPNSIEELARFYKVTLADISKRLGISRATFQNYRARGLSREERAAAEKAIHEIIEGRD